MAGELGLEVIAEGVELDPSVPDLIQVELLTFMAPQVGTLNAATISMPTVASQRKGGRDAKI